MIGKANLVALFHGANAEIDSRGVGNCTALQIAAFAGNLEVMKLLLGRNAANNLERGKHGRALKAASDRGHSDIYDLLVKKGASQTGLNEGEPKAFSSVNSLPQELSYTTDVVGQVPVEENLPPMNPDLWHCSQGSRANVISSTESARSTGSPAARKLLKTKANRSVGT